MDTDISDEIDRSFGPGPDWVAREEALVARGRRSLRRRRLAEGASGLLVAAVAVTGAIVATSGSPEAGISPAGLPSASASAAPEPPSGTPSSSDPAGGTIEAEGTPVVLKASLPGGVDVVLSADGTVHVRAGVDVVRVVDNPYDRKPPATSAAVIYVTGGETHWYAGYVDAHGAGGSTDQLRMDTMSFPDWVAANAPIQVPGNGTAGAGSGPDSWPGQTDLDLVRFAQGSERLVPVDGVTMIEQRAHPDVGASFATGTDRSAVAEVSADGRRWYVLARRSAGAAPQYIAVSAADGGATLDDFLDLARGRYAEGGGGLL